MQLRQVCVVSSVLLAAVSFATAGVIDIDLTDLYNYDNICNYYDGIADTGNGPQTSYLVTDSYALYRNATTGNGLPDDGFFAAAGNGVGFDVQLGYRNSDNGNNTVELTTTGASATVALEGAERDRYTSLYLFAWAKNGIVPLNYVITYADDTTSTGALSVQDWFTDNASFTYLINGMDRYYKTNQYENSNDPAVFAYSLDPDPDKVIQSITLTTGTVVSTRSAVIMGISGVVPEPGTLALLTLGATTLIGIRRRRRAA